VEEGSAVTAVRVARGAHTCAARPDPPLLALLFRLPLFRALPTTYRWESTLEFHATSQPVLHARWSRSSLR